MVVAESAGRVRAGEIAGISNLRSLAVRERRVKLPASWLEPFLIRIVIATNRRAIQARAGCLAKNMSAAAARLTRAKIAKAIA
jgi:hypothetical protein